MDKKVKSFAIAALRRASYRWPGRWMAEKASKVGRNQYICNKCKLVFKKKDTQMDHVAAIVDPVKGWQGFDSFIERLFVDVPGWQRLCKVTCHSRKTKQENKVRTKYRKIKQKVTLSNC